MKTVNTKKQNTCMNISLNVYIAVVESFYSISVYRTHTYAQYYIKNVQVCIRLYFFINDTRQIINQFLF